MEIRSITDVITNSSSEVFTIHPRPSETPESILEDLIAKNKEFLADGSDQYSGDCQDVEMIEPEKIHKKVYWPRYRIDNGFEGLEQYIKDNYIVHKLTWL
jgi:hypothetical protein